MASERSRLFAQCVDVALAAQAPFDQVENLVVNGNYIPYPWQWQFHAAARAADHEGGPVDIGLGGARGPGKSHGVLSQVALDDAQRIEGLKVLFLRQTGASAAESFDDLITKAIRGHTEYRKTRTSLRFPNGSRVVLGGFQDDKDIDKYIGIEYDVIIVEELTQLTKEKYEKLRGSLRTTKPNWRPRMYTSFNPGGIGHAWVRERYVLPYRAKQEKETRFIPSTYKENPALNQGYIEYLESLGGNLGKAWREGEWDIFEGQYFGEWRYDVHVVKPFRIPDTWIRYRSIDPAGRSGMTACHWYALDPMGNVWAYREYCYGPGIKRADGTVIEVGRDHDEHAKAISALSMIPEFSLIEPYNYTVMDTSAIAKLGYSETVAEIYERNGVNGLVAAAKERVVGWNAVHTYLRWDLSTPPKLRVFDTCVKLIEEIPLAQHDEHNPDDVADTRKGAEHWDAIDELRYFLRTLRDAKAPKPLSPVERKLRQLREADNTVDYSYMRK